MKFISFVDLQTMKEVILNSADYMHNVELCILYDMPNNTSIILEVYNGCVDFLINKHCNHHEYKYENSHLILDIEPNLKSLKCLKNQMKQILKEEQNGNK